MEPAIVYKSFKELLVWQHARSFKLDIYVLVQTFPQEEKFALISQLKRAARSVASNIAEGYGRFTYKDQLHFCIQSRGSLLECQNHLLDAYDCKYISDEKLHKYETKSFLLEKLLNGYISWLKKKMKERL